MSRQFENKPPCVGGCQPPYEQFVSKAGRPCQKCTLCGNLVWSNGKAAAAGPSKIAPENCAHDGGRLQKVANSKENKGRAYSVCALCNGNFEWADGGGQEASTSSAVGNVPQIALSTTVADLQTKYDALFKTMLVMQTQIEQQNERIEQCYFANSGTATTATATAAEISNKRRKT